MGERSGEEGATQRKTYQYPHVVSLRPLTERINEGLLNKSCAQTVPQGTRLQSSTEKWKEPRHPQNRPARIRWMTWYCYDVSSPQICYRFNIVPIKIPACNGFFFCRNWMIYYKRIKKYQHQWKICSPRSVFTLVSLWLSLGVYVQIRNTNMHCYFLFLHSADNMPHAVLRLTFFQVTAYTGDHSPLHAECILPL